MGELTSRPPSQMGEGIPPPHNRTPLDACGVSKFELDATGLWRFGLDASVLAPPAYPVFTPDLEVVDEILVGGTCPSPVATSLLNST